MRLGLSWQWIKIMICGVTSFNLLNALEEAAVSIFRVSWRWRQQVSLKFLCLSIELYGITSFVWNFCEFYHCIHLSAGCYPEIGHDCFLSNPYVPIIGIIFSPQLMLCNLCSWNSILLCEAGSSLRSWQLTHAVKKFPVFMGRKVSLLLCSQKPMYTSDTIWITEQSVNYSC